MNKMMLSILIVLMISLSFNFKQSGDNTKLRNDVAELETLNKGKQATIDSQKKEIEQMPNFYIETTKDIYREICLGLNQIDKVKSMPAQFQEYIKNSKEVKSNDKNTSINIDSKLPSDLIKLLNN